jgi:hypothetical protein
MNGVGENGRQHLLGFIWGQALEIKTMFVNHYIYLLPNNYNLFSIIC